MDCWVLYQEDGGIDMKEGGGCNNLGEYTSGKFFFVAIYIDWLILD